MTEALAASAPPTRLRHAMTRTRAWHPVVLGLAAAIACTYSWLQYAHPYLEHDDYDMLLPNGPAFVVNHLHRVLVEGRWLNYWYWLAGSSGLGMRGTVLIFALGWIVAVGVTVRSLELGWWSTAAAVALFGSPMMAEISFWPTTLTPAVWALAGTLTLLWFTRGRWPAQLMIVGVGTVAIVLGYPTIALLILPVLLALHHHESWRRLSALGGVFILSYVGGLLTVFALNAQRFGVFGIEIGQWRKPTPLNGLPSLGRHLSVFASDWRSWLSLNAIPVIAAAIALIATLVDTRLRRRVLVAAIALVVAIGLNAAPTILDGTTVPYRATGWAWPFLILLSAWALKAGRASARTTGAVTLLLIAVWASAYCATGELQRDHHINALRRFEAQVLAYRTPGIGPIFVVLRRDELTPPYLQTMWLLGNDLAKSRGIPSLRRAGPVLTAHTLRYVVTHDITQPIFVWHRRVMVVGFPASLLRWVEVSHPWWIEPFAATGAGPDGHSTGRPSARAIRMR